MATKQIALKVRKGNESAKSAIAASAASVGRLLGKTPGVDAVFLLKDEVNVVHVYSVARQLRPAIYGRLLQTERTIEKKHPEVAFEFHLRAHQGRNPAEAVPLEAELVYSR